QPLAVNEISAIAKSNTNLRGFISNLSPVVWSKFIDGFNYLLDLKHVRREKLVRLFFRRRQVIFIPQLKNSFERRRVELQQPRSGAHAIRFRDRRYLPEEQQHR